MRYREYEIALSPARLNRYMVACRGNKAYSRFKMVETELLRLLTEARDRLLPKLMSGAIEV